MNIDDYQQAALRTVNPSPYMFHLDTGDFALVGASPEVHVRLTDRKVEIRPIAGTRHRGKTTAEDVALEKELLADEKEKAEHALVSYLTSQTFRHQPATVSFALLQNKVNDRVQPYVFTGKTDQRESATLPEHADYPRVAATFSESR